MTSQRGGGRTRVVAIAAGVAALLLLAHLLDARAWLVSALEWIRGLGPWGAGGVLRALRAGLRASPARLGALGGRGRGLRPGQGHCVVSICRHPGRHRRLPRGALPGARLGRAHHRRRVRASRPSTPRWRARAGRSSRCSGSRRCSPSTCSTTPSASRACALRDYVLASWAGMLPGMVLYVYLGSLAGDVAGGVAAGRTRTPGRVGALRASGSWPRWR